MVNSRESQTEPGTAATGGAVRAGNRRVLPVWRVGFFWPSNETGSQSQLIPQSSNPALHTFAVAAAATTLALLGLGGLVTSHGVGMAVPDWPNTYGYNLFFFPVSQWVGGVFYEHTHRLAASAVGLMTCILALWLHGRPARRLMRPAGLGLVLLGSVSALVWRTRWADGLVLGTSGLAFWGASFLWPGCRPSSRSLRRWGRLAVAAVVFQGLLGGLRVVLFKDQIGIFHALLAQLFFVLLCLIALRTSPRWLAAPLPSAKGPLLPKWWFALFAAGSGLILLQLVLGATMRHAHAGLAIPDFPLAYGKLWPPMDAASVLLYNQRRLELVSLNPITSFQIGLQMAHRLTAVLILAVVAFAAWATWRRVGARHPLGRITLAWLVLILSQAVLGAATIWSNKAADVATAHVLVGALSLAAGSVLCLAARRSVAVVPAGDGVGAPRPQSAGSGITSLPCPAETAATAHFPHPTCEQPLPTS